MLGSNPARSASSRTSRALRLGDPLERLRAVVEFEAFREELEAALSRADRSRSGRPPP